MGAMGASSRYPKPGGLWAPGVCAKFCLNHSWPLAMYGNVSDCWLVVGHVSWNVLAASAAYAELGSTAPVQWQPSLLSETTTLLISFLIL